MQEEIKSFENKMLSDTSHIESEILEVFKKGRRTIRETKSKVQESRQEKILVAKSNDPLYTINQYNLIKRFILINSIDTEVKHSLMRSHSSVKLSSHLLANLSSVKDNKRRKYFNVRLVLTILKEEMKRNEFYWKFHSEVKLYIIVKIKIFFIGR